MKNLFKTVASFTYSSEALIVKGRLEAEGIEVDMMDMHTIDVDPLVSNAIGGVKIRVKSDDVLKALLIIDGIQKYSITEEGKPIVCPICNENKIILTSTIDSFTALFSFLISFFLVLLPFYQSLKYRCSECNHKFNIDE